MLPSQDSNEKKTEKESSFMISNGINYLMNKATIFYKPFDQKENTEEKTVENELKSTNIPSTDTTSNWLWYDNASWIPFEPITSNEIDSNITSYLNNNIISNIDNTLTFPLSKGTFFNKPQNKNIYIIQCQFEINANASDQKIKKIYQLNKNTNFKRELKRDPPFQCNSNITTTTTTKTKSSSVDTSTMYQYMTKLNTNTTKLSEYYEYIKDIDINDYIPYRSELKLDELLDTTKDLHIPYWWHSNKKSKCIFGENVFEVSLKRNISKDIISKFMEGIQFDNDKNDEFEMNAIYCIQNKSLYRLYGAFKMILKDYLGENMLNERYLWHGTNINAAKSICQTGFNRDYGEVMAYGKGVYFAKNSGYSSDSRYSKPDNDKYQYMFLCRVLLGESCRGDVKYKIPPCKTINSYYNFESMVNNLSNPTIFVISKDNQCYPEFLVKFKKIPQCLFLDKFE